MITRLPKWAELTFAGHCAAAGAIAHPPDEDLNGWGYLVDFLLRHILGPAVRNPLATSTYGSVTGIVTFTISASNFEEIASNFLGLGSGLPICNFSFTPARFGVLSPKPDIDFLGDGKVVISPNPVDTCEVKIRANETSYSL